MKYFDTVLNDKICFGDVTFLWVTYSESTVSFYLEPAVPLQFPCRLLQQRVQELHGLWQASPTWILLPHFQFGQVSQYECRLRFHCCFFAK